MLITTKVLLFIIVYLVLVFGLCRYRIKTYRKNQKIFAIEGPIKKKVILGFHFQRFIKI